MSMAMRIFGSGIVVAVLTAASVSAQQPPQQPAPAPLTPGTLSVDVSDDRKTLTIHCIDAESGEAAIDQISGGFETRVLEVFR